MKWYCENCEKFYNEDDPRLIDYTKDRLPICPECNRALDPEDEAEE